MTEPVSPSVGWGVLHLFCQPRPLLDAEAVRAAVKADRGDRPPGRDGRHARPQGRPGLHGARARPAPAPPVPDGAAGGRARRGRLLRVAHRGVASTPRACPSRCSRPACTRSCRPEGKPAFCFYPMSKRREARAELVHAAVRRAQRADARARRLGADLRRPGAAGHHRLDRARRLRVGRHAVRRPSRRPEGGRLHHALRPGVGHLRRVRPFYAGMVTSLDDLLAGT